MKTGKDNDTRTAGSAGRHPTGFPAEEEILAFAPEGWTNYIRQLGTDFIAQVSIYNEVLGYLDAPNAQGTIPEVPVNRIGPNRIEWLPKSRVLLLENTALGVCWIFWIKSDWEPVETAKAGHPARHRRLELTDVGACIKLMSPAAYAEHLEWEMERSKH